MQLVSCDMNCSLLLSFSAQGVCSLYLNFAQHTKHCFFMLEVHAFVNLIIMSYEKAWVGIGWHLQSGLHPSLSSCFEDCEGVGRE